MDLLHQLFKVVWHEETVPKQWREGLIVNLFKKGDKEDPGNYRGITLLSIVGKVFCKVINVTGSAKTDHLVPAIKIEIAQ